MSVNMLMDVKYLVNTFFYGIGFFFTSLHKHVFI